MKRIMFLIVLCAVLFPLLAHADYFAIKKSTEWIKMPLRKPFDSLGIDRKPDSVHVEVTVATATAAVYKATNTSYPFSAIYIDTNKSYAGDTTYYLRDSVGRLNAGETVRVLNIRVTMFTGVWSTPTYGQVQVTSYPLDSLAYFGSFAGIRQFAIDSCVSSDSLIRFAAKLTLDSLIARDKLGLLFGDSTFSPGLYAWVRAHGGIATLSNAQMAAIGDTVWLKKVNNAATYDTTRAGYYLRSGWALPTTQATAITTAIFAKKIVGAYATFDSSFGYYARVSLDTANQASTGDIAATIFGTDTGGYNVTGTFGRMFIIGGTTAGGAGADVASILAGMDSAKFLKAYMPNTLVHWSGLRLVGLATDTFSPFYVTPYSTKDLPAVNWLGGSGSNSHGLLAQAGASGGNGIYSYGPAGIGLNAVGLFGGRYIGGTAVGQSGLYVSGGHRGIQIVGDTGIYYSSAVLGSVGSFWQADRGVEYFGNVDGFGLYAHTATGGTGIYATGGDHDADFDNIGTQGTVTNVTNNVGISLLDENGKRRAVMSEGWTVQDYLDYQGAAGAGPWSAAAVDSLMAMFRDTVGSARIFLNRVKIRGSWPLTGALSVVNTYSGTSAAGAFFDGGTTTNDIIGYLGTVSPMSVYGIPSVDVASISGSAPTADNIETIFDGNATTRGTAEFSTVNITNSNPLVAALTITNTGGVGMSVYGGTDGIRSIGWTEAGISAMTLSPGTSADFQIGTAGIGSKPRWPDSLNLGGSGGGMSYTQFTDWMDENHAVLGCGTSAGSGAWEIILTVRDNATNVDVQGIPVTVKNSVGTTIALPTSNSSGQCVVMLDAGTYILRSFAVGYTFAPDTIVVTGDASHTFEGYNSFSTNRCRVWGQLNGINGPADGIMVRFTLPTGSRNSCDTSYLWGRDTTVYTDASGVFEANLPYSSCYNNAKYLMAIPDLPMSKTYQITVPDSTRYRVKF